VKPSCRQLFLTFLRLGLTAFGGPAMVAYIRDLAVRNKHWLSEKSFADGTALCQSIPGATAMQVAAYVGLRARGAAGALAAFVGFGLPAFVLMLALSGLYQVGRDLQPVVSFFRGLNVIVVALVANAAVNFGRNSMKNWRDLVLALGAGTLLCFRGNPILAIVASAAAGMVFYRGAKLPIRPVRAAGQPGEHLMVRPIVVAILAGGAALAVLHVANRRLFDLATLMVKVDLFAFGGGFASVPVMLHHVVDVWHWMDSKTFMDGIALGQVTPGPIVITATFVGYQLAVLSDGVDHGSPLRPAATLTALPAGLAGHLGLVRRAVAGRDDPIRPRGLMDSCVTSHGAGGVRGPLV